MTDDHAFRALLHALAAYGRPAFDLFRFASGVPAETEHAILTGHAPWWTALVLRIHFVRPLTGLLFAADDALAGSHALFYHLHSIVWYLALVLAVGALYRRLFPSGLILAFLAVRIESHACGPLRVGRRAARAGRRRPGGDFALVGARAVARGRVATGTLSSGPCRSW